MKKELTNELTDALVALYNAISRDGILVLEADKNCKPCI